VCCAVVWCVSDYHLHLCPCGLKPPTVDSKDQLHQHSCSDSSTERKVSLNHAGCVITTSRVFPFLFSALKGKSPLLSSRNSMCRVASVYKPERRKVLQDLGYTLAGSMGDQFSDLSGLYPAVAGWKLPNPMYAII